MAFLLLAIGLALPASGLGASVTVNVGGTRSDTGNGATSYANSLAGVQFEAVRTTSSGGTWGGTPFTGTCTTDATGTCVISDVPNPSSGTPVWLRVRPITPTPPAPPNPPAAPYDNYNVLPSISFAGGFGDAGVPTAYQGTRTSPSNTANPDGDRYEPALVRITGSDNQNVMPTPFGRTSGTGPGSTGVANRASDTTEDNNRFVLRHNNPAWPNVCGIDLHMVLDQSGSIDTSGYRKPFFDAAEAFILALADTPTTLTLSRFAAGYATWSNQAGGSTFDLSNPVHVANAIQRLRETWGINLDGTLTATYPGGGGTNWDLALWESRNAVGLDDALIFITDGNPTVKRGATGSPGTVHHDDITHAVASANTVKSSGARIVAVGAGTGINATNLAAVSGPNPNDDYYATADVQGLEDQLTEVASRLCGARINIKKYLDGAESAAWTFTGSDAATGVTFVPDNGVVQTTANGTALLSLNNIPLAGTNLTVTETLKAGTAFVGAKCQKGSYPSLNDAAATQQGSPAVTIGSLAIKRTDEWFCTFVN